MLNEILPTQTAQLKNIALAWQAQSAATGLFLVVRGQVIWQWPPEAIYGPPHLTAPVIMNGVPTAELAVLGCTGAANQTRLVADAHLLGHVLGAECELEMMTGDLIETQDQLLALYDLTRSTRSHLEIENTLQSIVAQVAALSKVDGVFALLQAPPEWPRLVTTYPENAQEVTILCDLFRQTWTEDEELLLQGDEAVALLPSGIRNLLILPLNVRQGKVLAGLGLVNKQLGDFHSPDLKLIHAIAEQVSAQIENALLLHETVQQAQLQSELKLAQKVQLQLLPQHPPAVPGLDLFARSLPALQVGGDFYDFIYEADRTLIFTVGDVSGKGVSSALLMAMIRTVIRSAGKSVAGALPQTLLDRANHDLYDDFTDVMMFATVFIGQYDVRRRRLIYANAGHSPVIFCSAGQPARMLEADGTAVGILPVNLALNQELPFRPGDILVVATDGFCEARNAQQEMFGYDRLLALVENHCDKTAAEIATMLYTAVRQFAAGGPQDDDQTLVVVKGV